MIRKLIGPDYPKTSCECVECETKFPLWPARKARVRDTNNLGLESKNQLKKIDPTKTKGDPTNKTYRKPGESIEEWEKRTGL